MNNKILNKLNTVATKGYKFFIAIVAIVFIILIIMVGYIVSKKYSVTVMTVTEPESRKSTQILQQEEKNIKKLKEIINVNTSNIVKEELYVEEADLEFTTRYEKSDKIAAGTIQVVQDGIDGKQKITKKKKYINDELISDETVGSQIVKSSVDKIVKIGTGPSYLKYQVSKNDTMYVTSNTLALRQEANNDAQKIITINENDEIKVLQIEDDWYLVQYGTYSGWAKADCLTKNDPNKSISNDNEGGNYSKSQLLQNLSLGMSLNKKSGLSLAQFEKIFENNENDKKGVMKENAKYFYYAEQQYNVNGVFLASVAIHESNWGTSAMAQNKKNLFGYGAYDRDPSGNAYSFESYAEGIDLLARVFVKYYLNPKGTTIYNGEIATGSHYNGNTLTAVNTKYATDKNWANSVYKWMQYLYNKI